MGSADLLRCADEDKEAKIRELHGQLKDIMLRRLKRDVIKSLPTKSESILRVEMSQMQTYWYKNILARVSQPCRFLDSPDMFAELRGPDEHVYAKSAIFAEHRYGVQESRQSSLLV